MGSLCAIRDRIERIAILFRGSLGVAAKNLQTSEELLINADALFPAGSLMKIPLLIAVASEVDQGVLKFTDRILIDPNTPQLGKQRDQDGSGILAHLKIAHQLTIEELCVLAIIISDNAAANALVQKIGMRVVNETLLALGFPRTKINLMFEDFELLEDISANPTTPAEMMRLLEMLYREQLPFSKRILDILRKQQFDFRIPLLLDEDVQVAHKTASLITSFHDVGIVSAEDCDYILCALTKNVPSKSIAELAIAEISRIVFDTLCGNK